MCGPVGPSRVNAAAVREGAAGTRERGRARERARNGDDEEEGGAGVQHDQVRAEFVTVDLLTCEANHDAQQPGLWITQALEPGAHGLDPEEYFL